ncbi:MAG: aspartate dehydrogenase [Candidatus Omnitrophica bacterium]|nr:aspartate dehydrogenase [Candidatus Omnitrophota bacterium]
MPGKLRIGIVGCGAIGSSLAGAIVRDFSRQARLVALFDLDQEKSRRLSRRLFKKEAAAVKSLGELIRRSELVVECSCAAASAEIAGESLDKGRDVMVMSVGGLVSSFNRLSAIAGKKGRRIFIPSGAISGIDGLKAAGIRRIRSVLLTTRKNPAAFKGVEYVKKLKIDLDKVRQDKTLYFGPAIRAVRFFPQNINVAAVLSLAGIGADKTYVKIVASPGTKKNIHEIQILSEAAKITTRTENITHPDNPKTSYLAVLSAIATLRGILAPAKIGT